MPQLCLEPNSCKIIGIERVGGEEMVLKYQVIVTPVNQAVVFV